MNEEEKRQFEEYLRDRLSITSDVTIHNYLSAVEHFFTHFKKVSERNVYRFLKQHRNYLYLSAMKHYLKFKGIDIDLEKARIKKAKQPLPYTFDLDDFVECVKNIQIDAKEVRVKDVKWLILMGIHTGCRRKELFNLKGKDLDKQEMVVYVRRKGGRVDKIKLGKFFKEFFDFVFNEKGILDEEYVFFTDCKSRKSAYVYYRKLIDKSNLPHKYKWMLKRTHNWRRAVAMFILEKTRDVFKVKEILGHVNIQTSMIYIQEWMREKAREEGWSIIEDKINIDEMVEYLRKRTEEEEDDIDERELLQL